MCLVGPPGVGKTSIAKSIARALNRKFYKISLGGVRDEAEIRGHRKTYVGSMPGRIIQGLKKVGVTNPVFLLDEVDKTGEDYKGDPSNALLEVLDPEQNKYFSDNFIEEPYDLSNVLFIATANYYNNIPHPLLDRMEIIELSSYTEIEKLKIAQRHLVKKAIQESGLNADNVNFTDSAITKIIQGYTREAGVRELYRQIGSICRFLAVETVKDPINVYKEITPEIVEIILKKPLFDFSSKEKEDQIGVVTGLAYTQFGGDILPVEVNFFPGNREIIMTGNLGKVMTESAQIALDFVKANADRYGIDKKLFEEKTLHIHFPEGAVPKDGPSAGVTITTGLISALTFTKVHSDIGMTGEISLRGLVMPIGGLREKSIAAHRAGLKKIVIPFENSRDLDEVPDIVKSEMEIVFAKTIDDVLFHALVR
jgi:ATP-dependent Lon protease